MKLKQVIPLTEEEKTEHGVAAERRRMRLVYADTIKDLLTHCVIQDGMCTRGQLGYAGRKLVPSHPLLMEGERDHTMDLCPCIKSKSPFSLPPPPPQSSGHHLPRGKGCYLVSNVILEVLSVDLSKACVI